MENEYSVKETQLGTETTHPSYGTLRFNRRHKNSKTPLFGSSIEHGDTITMEVKHADITRGLHTDWIHGKNAIVEIEMSYSQFAEAITSFGCGSGVPCTVRYSEKDGRIPECDFVNKRHQFTDEFKNKTKNAMNESQQLIRDVTDLFSQKKTLTKTDKESILKILNKLSGNIGCNLDFIVDQFNEQMDKTIMEAKGEIESFCQNKINSIASTALAEHKDEILKLDNPVDIELE